MAKRSSAETTTTSGSSSFTAGKFLLFILVTVAVGCLVLKRDEVMDEHVEAKLEAGETENRIPPGMCPKFCEARLQQQKNHHGGTDFTKPSDMLAAATTARDAMIDRMKNEMYGEKYYQSIFTTDGEKRRKFFIGAGDQDERLSEKRFQRKLGLKLLRIQMELMKENSNLEGCDCTQGSRAEESARRRRRLGTEDNDDDAQKIVLPPVKSLFDSVVWSSGGHSAAAGHGNLLHESYPEYMEALAKDVFKSVGLDLIGRNFAMGGMDTTPEIALCLEAKMGLDADIISWDSGMTEAGHMYKLPVYANRIGAAHRNRPIFAGIQIGPHQDDTPRLQSLRELEEWGMSALYFPSAVHNKMHEGYPDMSALSGEEAEKVAPYAAYFRCKDMIEDGEPRCKDMKYNDTICPNRFGKASWHPGWKWHANVGHAMALFMVDSLVGALEDLSFAEASKVTGDTYDPIALHDIWQRDADKDYQTFHDSALELPTNLHDFMPSPETEDSSSEDELRPWILARSPSICHSAFLPSESRKLGLFDGNKPSKDYRFDEGIAFEDIKKKLEDDPQPPPAADPDHARPMKLAKDGKLHVNGKNEDGSDCGHAVIYDFKDWLSATNKDGWTSVTFPNRAELDYYKPMGVDEFKPRGFVMMCFLRCDWGKCPEGQFNYNNANFEETLEMTLNGKRIVDKQLLGGTDCGFLKHERGFAFEPNNNGQYELKVRVGLFDKDKPDLLSFIGITSLIVL